MYISNINLRIGVTEQNFSLNILCYPMKLPPTPSHFYYFQVTALAGCDLLTISPKLLAELEASSEDVPEQLSAAKASESPLEKIPMDEKTFRWMMNEDQMANDKLSEGIRKFAVDQNKMDSMVRALLQGRDNLAGERWTTEFRWSTST